MASTGSCSEGSFWTCIPESFRTFPSDEAASLGKNLQCEKVLVIVRQRKKKEMKSITKPKVTWFYKFPALGAGYMSVSLSSLIGLKNSRQLPNQSDATRN